MIKVSVFYPRKEGAKFNMKYYADSHLPLVRGKLGDSCKGIVIDRGVRGGAPDTPAPFLVIADLLFDDVEAFQNAFRPVAQEIMADIPNFTNVQPTIQVSEMSSA